MSAHLDAEKDIIGAILLHPDSLRFAIEHVTGDDFADRRLGAAFNVANGYRGTGTPIDETTLAAGMTERGYKTRPVDLFDLKAATPTHENIGYYAKIVADAAGKRRLESFGARAQQVAHSDAPYAEIMGDVRRAWDELTVQAASGLTAPTLAEVLDGPDDYDWLVPNLLERQDRLVVTGGEGAGKSYWIQQIAVLSAAGIHPTTFQQIDPIRVLIVDAENSEKQWRRRVRSLSIQAARYGQVDPAETVRLATVPRLNLTDERDLAAVHRLVDEHRPDMLVIGPLYRLIPRAIQSDDDAAPLITALDGLRARGCALVMEAHAGHAKDGTGARDLRPRGSSALMGWPEFGLGLQLIPPQDGDDGRTRAAVMRWRGDRDQRAWPNTLVRGGRWPWSDDNPEQTAMAYQESQIGA